MGQEVKEKNENTCTKYVFAACISTRRALPEEPTVHNNHIRVSNPFEDTFICISPFLGSFIYFCLLAGAFLQIT